MANCEWKRIVGTAESGMYLIACGEVELLNGTPKNSQPCPYCQRLIVVTVEQRALDGAKSVE